MSRMFDLVLVGIAGVRTHVDRPPKAGLTRMEGDGPKMPHTIELNGDNEVTKRKYIYRG